MHVVNPHPFSILVRLNLLFIYSRELHVNKISSIDAQVFYKIPELCHL